MPTVRAFKKSAVFERIAVPQLQAPIFFDKWIPKYVRVCKVPDILPSTFRAG